MPIGRERQAEDFRRVELDRGHSRRRRRYDSRAHHRRVMQLAGRETPHGPRQASVGTLESEGYPGHGHAG